MKYIILLGDGMADWPIDELGGRTPLEYANTPNIDRIAGGLKGMLRTVPDGLPPGSDVANMSVLGYDPLKYYTGRAPLEAISKSIELSENDVAYRCNFVTIENGIMKDFAAGHIPTEKALKLIELLNREIDDEDIEFFGGVSYRNLMIWRGGKTDRTTPPHDISDKPIGKYLPRGEAKEKLLSIMERAQDLLSENGIYPQANAIWLWGEGKRPSAPPFEKLYAKKGCMISAVDLMVGLGRLTGLYIPEIEGLTGFIDTNFSGKVNAALEFLASGGDFVYLHVEATDEAGHMGDLQTKVRAIELFDKEVVGEILKGIEDMGQRARIAVLPDHPTPLKIKTHTAEPVPFALFDTKQDSGQGVYSENSCREGVFIGNGHEFIKKWLFGE